MNLVLLCFCLLSLSSFVSCKPKSSVIRCLNANDYATASRNGADFAGKKDWKAALACFSIASDKADFTEQKIEAMCNIAACQGADKKHEDAVRTLAEAIRTSPQAVRPHLDLGRMFARSNNMVEKGISYLTKAIELDPKNVDAIDELAHLYFRLDRPYDAVEVYKSAVIANPKFSKGYQQIAVIMREGKRYEESARNYKAAINLEPRNAHYRYSYGNMLFDSGDPALARVQFTEAIRLDPTFADAFNNKGNAERSLGLLEEAYHSFAQGLKVNPKGTMFLLNMGQVFQDMQRYDECIRVAKEALEIDPNVAEGYLLLGSVAYAEDRLKEAVPHYRMATKLNPTMATAYVSLANTLGDIYRKGESMLVGEPSKSDLSTLKKTYKDCITAYKSLLAIDPSNAEAFANYMWARKYVCDWDEWHSQVASLESILDSQCNTNTLPSLKPFLALSFPIHPKLYKCIAYLHALEEKKKATNVANAEAVVLPFKYPQISSQDPRLTVAYISTDLHDHPVGHQAWFHLHSNPNLRILVISLGKNDGSEWRKNIMARAGANFHDLQGLNPAQLAVKLNQLQIHILITLNGWTSGHQMGTFGLRPCPVLFEYMGAHDTTGADFMDYFISDTIATPPEYAAFYSEKIILTPDSFFVNEYAESRKHILEKPKEEIKREDHGLPVQKDAFVFCNFNQLFKVDPETFAMWMRVLKTVPNSVLWLLRLPFGAEENLRNYAQKAGISSDRLIFTNRGDWNNHLYVKALANLSLDNPLFNSHTSGVDILWAGVPMLTIATDRMSGRVAASLLSSVIPDGFTVARSLEDYYQIAAKLASQQGRQKLKSYREKLEKARKTATLFDTQKLVQRLERGFIMAWEAHEASKGKNMHVKISK